MFSPLPLRLWCMANMAPALTEAATQARAKLSSSREGHHPSNPSLGSRRASVNLPPSLAGVKSQVICSKQAQVIFSKELLSSGVIETKAGAKPGSKHLRLKGALSLEEFAAVLKNSTRNQMNQCGTSAMNSPNTDVPAVNKTSSTPQQQPAIFNGIDSTSTSSHVPPVVGTVCASKMTPTATSTTVSGSAPIRQDTKPAAAGTTMTPNSGPTTVPCASNGVKVRFMPTVEVTPDFSKRQREIERKTERVLRRVRRLQGRQAVAHIKYQLSGLVDHQHKNLQTMAKSMKSPNPSSASVDLKTELLQSEDVKSLSTAALVTLVRKLQSSQALSLRQRLAHQQATSEGGSSVLRLDEDLCLEMNRVAGTLQMNLHHLEGSLDSDATESSSGGESCDDDFDFDFEKPPKSSL